MPDRDVKTIQDLIYYQYSKIVARSAFGVLNGKEAKSKHYGFIKKTFRELKSGIKSWSEITREDRQFVEVMSSRATSREEKLCVYCGAENDLHWEHIVPIKDYNRSIPLTPTSSTPSPQIPLRLNYSISIYAYTYMLL